MQEAKPEGEKCGYGETAILQWRLFAFRLVSGQAQTPDNIQSMEGEKLPSGRWSGWTSRLLRWKRKAEWSCRPRRVPVPAISQVGFLLGGCEVWLYILPAIEWQVRFLLPAESVVLLTLLSQAESLWIRPSPPVCLRRAYYVRSRKFSFCPHLKTEWSHWLRSGWKIAVREEVHVCVPSLSYKSDFRFQKRTICGFFRPAASRSRRWEVPVQSET